MRHGLTNPTAQVTALHRPRVDGRQARCAWPEYTPDASASIGRRWFGASLGDFGERARSWDGSIGRTSDAHRVPAPNPRLKDLMNESVHPRYGRASSALLSEYPRGHGGYWRS